MKKWITLLLLASACVACTSNIQPLRPIQHVEVWVEDEPATAPATTAASAPASEPASEPAAASAPPGPSAPATEPATRPGHMVDRVVDPNETARFVYNASYDNVWRQAGLILTSTGFALDRQDYRLGVLTTKPLPSAQIIEIWKPQLVNATDSMENTMHSQRRWVRLTISKVEGKPEFYQIGIQVLVERETNPEETLGGPIFVEGSGFGRNAVTLRSDYATPKAEPGRWVILGHDPDLERKLLGALFGRI